MKQKLVCISSAIVLLISSAICLSARQEVCQDENGGGRCGLMSNHHMEIMKICTSTTKVSWGFSLGFSVGYPPNVGINVSVSFPRTDKTYTQVRCCVADIPGSYCDSTVEDIQCSYAIDRSKGEPLLEYR